MKVSRTRAEANRRRIIEAAGELFRENGFDGVGIADVMKAAGLTHGGFYGHFESKEDLAALACGQALSRGIEKWSAIIDHGEGDPLGELVRRYLSDRNRDEMRGGCVLAALGPEAARRGEAVRSSFAEGVRGYLAVLSGVVPGRSEAERRTKAIATLSGMLGALVLARAIDDSGLSREILEAVTSNLTSPADEE